MPLVPVEEFEPRLSPPDAPGVPVEEVLHHLAMGVGVQLGERADAAPATDDRLMDLAGLHFRREARHLAANRLGDAGADAYDPHCLVAEAEPHRPAAQGPLYE